MIGCARSSSLHLSNVFLIPRAKTRSGTSPSTMGEEKYPTS